MASPNRNQHFVPQFYLRYFATPETRDTERPQIWAFPIIAGEEFVTRTRNVAAQRDLYAFCDSEVDQRLTELESMLAEFWPNVSDGQYPISESFRKGVSLFIASLYLRHPKELANLRVAAASIARAVRDGPHDTWGRTQLNAVSIGGKIHDVPREEIEDGAAWTDKDIQAEWGAQIMSETGLIAQELIKRPWTVAVTKTPAFITTDHPVTLVHPTRRDAPILNADTTVYFPISPTKLLIINEFNERDGDVVQIADKGAAVFNYSIFRAAYRFVFSPWDSIFVLDQVIRFEDWGIEEQRRINEERFGHLRKEIGRNDPCYCGSGRKFKKCCLK